MQPYKWGGRFYNDKNDSILRRLKNFVKSFYCVATHHLLQAFSKKAKNRPSISDECVQHKDACVLVPHSTAPLITWLGHSTFLIQVGGINIITDPMFFSGFPVFSRKTPMPFSPVFLPHIDVVLVSHNHKDHLDVKSLRALKTQTARLFVPIGNKRWLSRLGCKYIAEKTWWETEVVDFQGTVPTSVTFLPAIHWTSRGLFDINKSLWGSWLIETDGYKIYFAGDSAYGDHFSLIAQRYGRIDIVLMPIAPNEPRRFVAESHVNAHEAVQAFIDLRARHFIPMHWGTFERMGSERHDDPIARLKDAWNLRASDLAGAQLHVVTCGEQKSF